MINKTKEQTFADQFDCKLFDLIEQASRQSAPHWQKVFEALVTVRRLVRSKMHPDDCRNAPL